MLAESERVNVRQERKAMQLKECEAKGRQERKQGRARRVESDA